MAFKVGDKVRVVGGVDELIGEVGVVDYVNASLVYPFSVDFGEMGGYPFTGIELELVSDD